MENRLKRLEARIAPPLVALTVILREPPQTLVERAELAAAYYAGEWDRYADLIEAQSGERPLCLARTVAKTVVSETAPL